MFLVVCGYSRMRGIIMNWNKMWQSLKSKKVAKIWNSHFSISYKKLYYLVRDCNWVQKIYFLHSFFLQSHYEVENDSIRTTSEIFYFGTFINRFLWKIIEQDIEINTEIYELWKYAIFKITWMKQHKWKYSAQKISEVMNLSSERGILLHKFKKSLLFRTSAEK